MVLTGKIVAHVALTLMVQEMAVTMLPGDYLQTDASGMKMYDSRRLLTKEDAPALRDKLEICLRNNMLDAVDCYNAAVPTETPSVYRQYFLMIWSGTLGTRDDEWKDEIK